MTPLVPSAGVTVKAPPLHAEAVIGVIEGTGLTVTVKLNGAPGQLPNAADVTGITV